MSLGLAPILLMIFAQFVRSYQIRHYGIVSFTKSFPSTSRRFIHTVNIEHVLHTNEETSEQEGQAISLLVKRLKLDNISLKHKAVLPKYVQSSSHHQLIWSTFRNNVHIDSTVLEPQFLGKYKMSDEETVNLWRKKILERTNSNSMESSTLTGELAVELSTAIEVIQRCAFVSRSFQHYNKRHQSSTSKVESTSKSDLSPVTVADFALQAIIIDRLHQIFPDDAFIAEEDSSQLQRNDVLCEEVMRLVIAGTGEQWTKEKLFTALDLGQYEPVHGNNTRKRIWVLDPIDGTKGFIRGEHYCIALGLLINNKPELSVLGCPNLNLLRVLEQDTTKSKKKQPISYIESPLLDDVVGSDNCKTVFHPDCGSLYFAVSGYGAYAKSLTMPLSRAFEVTTSNIDSKNINQVKLCEAYEASHGNRAITTEIAKLLDTKHDFTRIDGQCKHCVVGAGAADATLRLPPDHYREKIWDHVAGLHFVREAGGKVTDLNGDDILFDGTRYLSKSVKGVISSNGYINHLLVEYIQKAKDILAKKDSE